MHGSGSGMLARSYSEQPILHWRPDSPAVLPLDPSQASSLAATLTPKMDQLDQGISVRNQLALFILVCFLYRNERCVSSY